MNNKIIKIDNFIDLVSDNIRKNIYTDFLEIKVIIKKFFEINNDENAFLKMFIDDNIDNNFLIDNYYFYSNPIVGLSFYYLYDFDNFELYLKNILFLNNIINIPNKFNLNITKELFTKQIDRVLYYISEIPEISYTDLIYLKSLFKSFTPNEIKNTNNKIDNNNYNKSVIPDLNKIDKKDKSFDELLKSFNYFSLRYDKKERFFDSHYKENIIKRVENYFKTTTYDKRLEMFSNQFELKRFLKDYNNDSKNPVIDFDIYKYYSDSSVIDTNNYFKLFLEQSRINYNRINIININDGKQNNKVKQEFYWKIILFNYISSALFLVNIKNKNKEKDIDEIIDIIIDTFFLNYKNSLFNLRNLLKPDYNFIDNINITSNDLVEYTEFPFKYFIKNISSNFNKIRFVNLKSKIDDIKNIIILFSNKYSLESCSEYYKLIVSLKE